MVFCYNDESGLDNGFLDVAKIKGNYTSLKLKYAFNKSQETRQRMSKIYFISYIS